MIKKALSAFISLALLPLWLMAEPAACPDGKDTLTGKKTCDRFIDQDDDGQGGRNQPLPLAAPLIAAVAGDTGEPVVPDTQSSSPYSPLTWSALPLLVYALTSVLSRTNRIRKQTHRYLWNLVLMTVFAISSCFGLVLTCSLAYDWHGFDNYYDLMRTWHVNAGVFMLVIGTMHLARRFHYFLKLPHYGKRD